MRSETVFQFQSWESPVTADSLSYSNIEVSRFKELNITVTATNADTGMNKYTLIVKKPTPAGSVELFRRDITDANAVDVTIGVGAEVNKSLGNYIEIVEQTYGSVTRDISIVGKW